MVSWNPIEDVTPTNYGTGRRSPDKSIRAQDWLVYQMHINFIGCQDLVIGTSREVGTGVPDVYRGCRNGGTRTLAYVIITTKKTTRSLLLAEKQNIYIFNRDTILRGVENNTGKRGSQSYPRSSSNMPAWDSENIRYYYSLRTRNSAIFLFISPIPIRLRSKIALNGLWPFPSVAFPWRRVSRFLRRWGPLRIVNNGRISRHREASQRSPSDPACWCTPSGILFDFLLTRCPFL